MEDIGFFMIFGVFMIGFVGYSIYQKRVLAEAWEDAARSMGLLFQKGGLFSKTEMSGTYRGKQVRAWIRSERRGSGKHSTTVYYTVFQVELSNPDWAGVKIGRRGFGAKVASFFGGQDIEVGDSSFDKSFRIRGSLSERVREALRRPTVQSEIKGLSTSFGSFVLEEGALRVENQERVRNASRLRRYIERLVDRSATLDSAVSGGGVEGGVAAGEDLFPDVAPVTTQSGGNNGPVW